MKLLGKLFSTPKQRSVIDALLKITKRPVVERIITECPDRRAIIDVAASELGLSPTDLGFNIARIMGIAYVEQVKPFDVRLLPEGCTVSRLRKLGSLPIVSQSGVVGLVTVDPHLAQPFRETWPTAEVYLARWPTIVQALDESELHYRADKETSNRHSKREIVWKVIGMLIEEVQSYGLASVLIRFEPSAISYEFQAPDGRRAKGSIHESVRAELEEALQDGARNGAFQVVLPSRAEPREIYVKMTNHGHLEIVLTWISQTIAVHETASDAPQTPTPPTNMATERPSPSSVVATVPIALPHSLRAQPYEPAHHATQGETSRPSNEGVEPIRREEPLLRTPDSPAPPKILVIDDNETFASVLRRFFARRHLEVVHLVSGVDALHALRSGEIHPALIICDVHMPAMTGSAFLEEVKAVEGAQDIPVVMLTSDTTVDTEVHLITQGADAFVAKNEDPRILCAHVERLIAKRVRQEAA